MPQYIVEITDKEQQILENDLLDVNLWIQLAVKGKVSNCKKRTAKAEIELLRKENAASMPVTDDALVAQHFSRAGYKNRVARGD